MIKLKTVTPYLKKIKKNYVNHAIQPMSSANIGIFSPEINDFCYIEKHRLNGISKFLKVVLINIVAMLMMISKYLK